MTETEKAYVAGYLEARNFRPHFSKGTYQLLTHASSKHQHFIRKVADMIGARLYESANPGFAESFLHDGRRAVYQDGVGVKITLWMAGGAAKKLILDIIKYLDPYTIKRFKPILEHNFCNPAEVRKKGGRTSYKKNGLKNFGDRINTWKPGQSGNPLGRKKKIV